MLRFYATRVEPLSCGGYGYTVLDGEGAVISMGGGSSVTEKQATEMAQRIIRGLDAQEMLRCQSSIRCSRSAA